MKEKFWSWLFVLILIGEGFLAGALYQSSKNTDITKIIDRDNYISIMEVDEASLSDRDDLDGAAGRYFGDGRIVCIPNRQVCQHEVGHAVDDFYGYPSKSKEFKKAIELHLKYCIVEEPEEVFCELIRNFPGVNGNPFHKFVFDSGKKYNWGGYGELYANIFEMSHAFLVHMPPSLDIFFNPEWEKLYFEEKARSWYEEHLD